MRHRGRSFAITLVRGSRECLWVGPAVGATVSGEPVRGPFEALDQLFAQPSAMLLVAASNLDTLHMLLRALVVRLCESRGVAVIVSGAAASFDFNSARARVPHPFGRPRRIRIA